MKDASENINLSNLINMSTFMDYYNRGRSSNNGYDVDALYQVLGLPCDKTIHYSDYEQKYRRQDIVSRIVKSPVLGSWRHEPSVYDKKDSNTPFNMAYTYIEKNLSLYFYLTKLDLLATLGKYSVLFLGLDDNKDPSIPADKAAKILYITPIPENRAEIQASEEDIKSPRFGLPTVYSITINTEVTATISQTVDHTRIIHIAENTLDSEVYGIPYLEPIFNNLIGLDTLALCSPVMFKGGSKPGYVAQPDESGIIRDEDITAAKSQIQQYMNDVPYLPRWLWMQGIKIQPLPVQVVSPADHVDVQLKLISAATRIPLRILTGSERGELASSQDERSWLSYLEERRLNVNERLILRPTIDRLIQIGVLPEPKKGEYTVEWPPLIVKSEKEQIEISKLKSETLKIRGEAIGGEIDYPITDVYKDWGKTNEEIEAQMDNMDTMIKEEMNEVPNQKIQSNNS